MKEVLVAALRCFSSLAVLAAPSRSIRKATSGFALLLIGVGLAASVQAQASRAQGPTPSATTPIPIYNPGTGKLNARFSKQAAVRAAETTGTSCTVIDFEGLANLAPIPTVQGVSLPDWLSIVSAYEAPGVGSGNFNGEPSPVTIAFWLYGNPNSQNVNVPNGASSISFYYSSYYNVTVTGYDAAGNQLATTTVPPNFDSGTGHYDIWQPVGITAPAGKTITSINISGYANYTGMDNLSVCQSPAIASVEMTQAIQQYQKLADLKASLQAQGEPPVPIVANKPAALRTYFNPVQDVTSVTVKLTGVDTQTKTLSLLPGCTVEKQRAQTGGCQSMDFYVTPPSGNWTAQLDVVDSSGNVLEEEVLPVTSRDTDSLRLRAVSVCDAKDASGNWLCQDPDVIGNTLSLITKIAPSSHVYAELSGLQVKEDIADFPKPQNGHASDAWQISMVKDVAHSRFWDGGSFRDIGQSRRTTYFGAVRPAPSIPDTDATDPLYPYGGIAYIGGYVATGRTVFNPQKFTDVGVMVVAHETGHNLGLKHNVTGVPKNSTQPGCWSPSAPPTDWPYSNNYLQSKENFEVGFDVALQSPLDPQSHFDIMGYCSPSWVSPQRYITMIQFLDGGQTSAAAESKAQAGRQTEPAIRAPAPQSGYTEGPFWTVSGTITPSGATIDPIFELTTTGDSSAGSGSYSIVVLSASGDTLFTRYFTPLTAYQDNIDGSEGSTLTSFAEYIPVTSQAASIVILDSTGNKLDKRLIRGKAPVVMITSPTHNEAVSGKQPVTWTVQGVSQFDSDIFYSIDSGVTWTLVGKAAANAESFIVDFDQLAGSSQSLIRVLVSDGVNTGTGTSPSFSVQRKKPRAIYITSPTSNYAQASIDPLLLMGSAYDADDGTLTGAALQWSSDIQGVLGTGSPLSVKLKPGTHTITLTATDSDGNAVTAKTTVLMGGAPPVVTLTVQPLNTVPTTCESATVGATPGVDGGAGLATVQYSVDGGGTYTTIPLAKLPYAFIVPGSGFVHVVARAYDLSRQSGAQDASFLVQSACQGITQAITFAPISNQIYGAAAFTLKATASSGLAVTYKVTGPATVSGSVLTITGVGLVTVTASQPGDTNYAPAAPVAQSFTVVPTALTATAASFTRAYGAANPTFTYALTGFVNGDTKAVVSGSAGLTTTATPTSPVGTYPIAFSAAALSATNYKFTYVAGTLTVKSLGTVSPPVISPAGGTYNAPQTVQLSDATSGSSIFYTTDGGSPSITSTKYTGTFTVASSQIISAIAIAPGYTPSSVASAVFTIATGGQCTVVDYKAGFTASGLSLNGSAKVVGGALQLTDGGPFEAGSGFFLTPLPLAAFTTDFTFQLVDPAADGITFMVQNQKPTALGQSGGGLGYAGIPHSVALKFDLHSNVGEGDNSTGTYMNGAFPGNPSLSLNGSGIDLHSGHPFAVHIDFSGTQAVMTLTDTVTKKVVTANQMDNLGTTLGSSTAYFGFTGGTGRLTSTAKILSWTYSSGCGSK